MKTRLLSLSIILATAALAISASANATTFTGKVQTLRLSAGTTAARVSVGSTQPTACGQPWFSFENASTGLGKLWLASLLAAKSQGKTVVIAGTGTCDSWSIERVLYIDVL